MRFLRQPLWLVLQAMPVAFFLWVAWEEQKAGRPPNVGMSLALGFVCSFVLTAILVAWIECFNAAQSWLARGRVARGQQPVSLR